MIACSPPALSRRLRCMISFLLVVHITAVLVGPLAVGPTSRLWLGAWQLLRPYIELLYLNHGYKFFAPEPGPSTVVAYTLHFADGSTRSGEFPSRSVRPRLLYHRHFMLSEYLNFAPPQWHYTYARHLGRAAGAESVSMSRMTRLLPTMAEVRNGTRLDDPEHLLETPLGTFRCNAL